MVSAIRSERRLERRSPDRSRQDALNVLRTQIAIRLSKTVGLAANRPVQGRASPNGMRRKRARLDVAQESVSAERIAGGADRDRTDDLGFAKPALSQLSYSPSRAFPHWSGRSGPASRAGSSFGTTAGVGRASPEPAKRVRQSGGPR